MEDGGYDPHDDFKLLAACGDAPPKEFELKTWVYSLMLGLAPALAAAERRQAE